MDIQEAPYVLAIILRLLAPLFILKNPFWGYVTAVGFDAIDLEILETSSRLLANTFTVDYARYQITDKLSDLYMNSFAVYMSLAWSEKIARQTALVLFIYRLIGVLTFLVTQKLIYLFIFFNLFELFYLFCAYTQKYRPQFKIGTTKRLLAILGIMALLQIAREYYLHLTDGRLWGTIKEKWLQY